MANKEVKLLQLVRKWGTQVMPLFAVLAGCDTVHMRGFGPAVALAIMQGTAKQAGSTELTVERLEATARRLSGQKKLHGASVPADFCAQLRYGLAVFSEQVVFDPITETDMPLSSVGEDEPPYPLPFYTPPEHCGDLATGETTVQLGEEQVSMLIAVATPRMRPPAAEWYGVKFCSASPRKEEPAASAAVACAAAAVVTKSGAASRPVASVEPARTSQLCIVLCVSLRLQADALIETLGRCSVISHCSTVPVNIPRSMTRP